MTTRLQVLRSSTTQAVPAAGTRLPGELWTNFPDLQMGVIDASKTAQKLIAVRYFSTQANYAVNDMVVNNGAIYFANGAITAGAFTPGQWTKIASVSDLSGAFVPISGGTMTGPLVGTTAQFNAVTSSSAIINGPAGGNRVLYLSTVGSDRWSVFADGTAEGGSNAGSNFGIGRYTDAGAFVDSPLVINRATGAIDTSYWLKLHANTTSVNPTLSLFDKSGSSRATLNMLDATGNVQLTNIIPNNWLVLNGDSSFAISASVATKPGGGSWTAPSDARIKTVVEPYKGGLGEVIKLDPVVYRYKGNDETADGQKPHETLARAGTNFVGLIAQEVEKVFSGMVTRGEGVIDGVKVDDLRILDTTPLTFALVNAVKELSARVTQLETVSPAAKPAPTKTG